MTFCDLKQRDVVNVCDGRRLGCVVDLEFDAADGRVCAIIVPGETHFLGLFKGGNDYIIPWNRIAKIGDDVILVDLDRQFTRR